MSTTVKKARKPRNMHSKLDVKVYAKHGDICGNAPHCEALGCSHVGRSGLRNKVGPDDYVQVAQFMYFQEAIDYCQEGRNRGVSMRLISWICPGTPHQTDYFALGQDKGPGLPPGMPRKALADLPTAVLAKLGALDPFQDKSPVHDPDVVFWPSTDGYKFLAKTSKGTRAILQASVEMLTGQVGYPGKMDGDGAKKLQEHLERMGCTVGPAQAPEPLCRRPENTTVTDNF